MKDLDRSIAATLAYYGAFGWPLTPLEVQERLIPASRLGGRNISATLGEILEHLPVQDFSQRIEQEKIWAQKWRRMLRKAWWLQAVPYVRGVYASGSLAMGNMSAQSDWDMFVIARSGRLYTTRLGLLGVAWLMRSLRTKYQSVASDTFCFNHYVITDGLSMDHRSLYTAHGVAMLVPVYDPEKYLSRLWRANHWIEQYRPMPIDTAVVRRSIVSSSVLGVVAKIGEWVLDSRLGNWLERWLKHWQQRRIMRDPATHQPGGRVIATDREIEFHPRSFEVVALERYHAVLVGHGLGIHREHNSGLTQ